jgi:hypothetical protein
VGGGGASEEEDKQNEKKTSDPSVLAVAGWVAPVHREKKEKKLE